MQSIKRFYRQAQSVPSPEGYRVELDGKPAHTPLRRPLMTRVHPLAEAVAAEFNAQEKQLVPETMPLTRLLTIALDIIADRRAEVESDLAAYGETDLLYYRDGDQPELHALQQAQWDAALEALTARYDIAFHVTEGVMPVAQAEVTLERLAQILRSYDDAHLAALALLAKNLSSVWLAIAVAEALLPIEQALVMAFLEEEYQARKWGKDEEAEAAREERMREARAAVRFLGLLDS